jgi:hypothetical protein
MRGLITLLAFLFLTVNGRADGMVTSAFAPGLVLAKLTG